MPGRDAVVSVRMLLSLGDRLRVTIDNPLNGGFFYFQLPAWYLAFVFGTFDIARKWRFNVVLDSLAMNGESTMLTHP